MKTPHILTALLYMGLLLPAKADVAQAERLLREGKPAEALSALELTPHSPAVLYWKGRALVDLNRPFQAVNLFREIPTESNFYPYAAKAIMYCAWQSPHLDFVEYVAPLTASPNHEIATLAQAALAEHQLRYTSNGDASTMDPLRELAKTQTELQPMVALLNIEELRRARQFDQALNACRAMEANASVPLIFKQRVRLAIAELYYDKATAEPQQNEQDEELSENNEGKGEETLLQFISANPDSVLLEEAFRRLETHNAFNKSEYAQRRLQEWSRELSNPHRAALALAVQQRLQFAGPEYNSNDATIANTAATQLPNEPLSQHILGEQVRYLVERGRVSEAALYQKMMQPDDTNPRYLFYKACCMPGNERATAELFLQCAEIASYDLQTAAICNAMYCAVLSGSQDIIDTLLAKEALPEQTRRSLLLTHAGLILHTNPAEAEAELQSAALLSPTEAENVEIMLQRAELELCSNPESAMSRLNECTPNQHRNWTDEQVLRFYSLQLQAIEKLNAAGGAYQDPISLLKDALANTRRTEVKTVLTVHLAHRLSLAKRHEEALDLLLQLAESTSNKETRARAYLLAARQAEQLKSLEQLTLAVELFAAAAEHNTRYRNHALMLQARVLAWINRGAEARRILSELLRRNDLSSSEQALALSIQAHEQTLRGTPEGLSEALLTNNRIFEVQNLSQAWITRARIQRASILARNGLTDEAIAQYMQLIESVSAATEAEMNDEKWFVLYFAGAGAVSQYLSQSKHAEAAELADMIAAWPLKPDAHRPVIGPGHRAQQFADWADNIRKFNFQSRALQPES
ncbi:MAG: hypothetical protein IKJ58_06175 [Akkermansia sp.]|nr:hypothetical protein [Akkermansia sp.]